jgi:hypothetical protein
MSDWDEDGYGDMDPAAGVDAGTDCEDMDASLNPADVDGDTISSCEGDCDDDNVAVGIVDEDGDTFSGCFVDCDDNDAMTYPGAAFNESATECLTDADGDGWGASSVALGFSCFEFDMADSYGDGWNGNSLDVYEDGVMTGSYANTSEAAGDEIQSFQHCLDAGTTIAEVIFVDGGFNGEVSFDVSVSDGASNITFVGSGDGDGLYSSINFDGVEYEDGTAIWSNDRDGADCDDADASVMATDADGDGSWDCAGDCDSSDADLNDNDADGDGYTTCGDDDGAYDCDDNDSGTTGDDDMDGYYIAGCNDDAAWDDCDDMDMDINPGEEEIYYDNVDSNCDGMSDFDADMDGDDVMMIDCDGDFAAEETECDFDADGVIDWTATGMDCDDYDADVEGLDSDGDGYATCEDANGLSDCDDGDVYTFPGAAELENGYDVADYTTYECLTDADEDGYAMGDSAQCYTISMSDDYGDGWNGNSIDVYSDGVMVGSATILSTWSGGLGTDNIEEYCVVNGSAVEFIFQSGSYAEEMSWSIEDDAGNILEYGYGNSDDDLVDSYGITYSDSEVFYTETAAGTSLIGGTDPNDADASVVPM